ncbi:teashirt homolog 3 [Chanos chanos]|uniref:Teashirt homolog 3 n=1 Tax=Chanos chanos TaxID=29144 RepID=A0A6J2WP60_CHACN|nr:teashirt homolog 3-like [Chanos chanos]
MPRRKQQAPRRAAMYDPDDAMEPSIQNEDLKNEDVVTEEKSDRNNDCSNLGFYNRDSKDSSLVELSGYDVDSGSHISESSDPMSDFESTPVKHEEGVTDFLKERHDDSAAGTDSLEQMKAIYKSFLTNSCWSSLNLNLTRPSKEKSLRSTICGSNTSSSSSSSSSSPENNNYDWHQSAMARSLQQNPYNKQVHPAVEQSIFSTVQLYRQSTKLYGSIFTGASKFRCKSCSAAYDSLVDLTVHMNKTGHYRDDNHEREGKGTRCWSKPRKRSLLEMEGKEDAQKVLRCMYCGHSFESLQDLSVHMIKTKHYQKVPLKEPVTTVSANILSSSKKRIPFEVNIASSPYSVEQTAKVVQTQKVPGAYPQKNKLCNEPELKSHNLEILTCMECGVSHDSLQELTAHMMVTGHFIKITNSDFKKVKRSASPLASPVQTITSEQIKPVSTIPSSSPLGETMPSPSCFSPDLMDIKKEMQEEVCVKDSIPKKDTGEEEKEETFSMFSKSDYLTEEDLKENPKGGLDILKSLENTVTSAIKKAQKDTPSWGGYQSIHAAYQLPSNRRASPDKMEKTSHFKHVLHGIEVLASGKSQTLFPSTSRQSSSPPKVNLHTMEELVKTVTEKVAMVEGQIKEMKGRKSPQSKVMTSPICESVKPLAEDSPTGPRATNPDSPVTRRHNICEHGTDEKEGQGNRKDLTKSPFTTPVLSDNTVTLPSYPEPTQPFVDPLSALQSVMNLHLGKAAKPVLPGEDPMSMILRMNNSIAEKAAVAAPSGQTQKLEAWDQGLYSANKDQPIDLSKGVSKEGHRSSPLTGTLSYSSQTTSKLPAVPGSPSRENVLSDISDMLRTLKETHIIKPVTPSLIRKRSDIEVVPTQEDLEDVSSAQKRKGRQSQWNPQHLLILQAQFTSSLRKTPEGKYVISDLSPQERMVISRITGLSMTTISHWLANVKYQLRRTGRTKFLKNIDSGSPVFLCSECASQIQTRSAYVCHLESHLGFRLQDLTKLSQETLRMKMRRNIKKKSVLSLLTTPRSGNKEQLIAVQI